MTFQEKQEHDAWVRDYLCPLGRCTRNVRKKGLDGIVSEGICGGKIVEVYASYKNDRTLYVEKECLKCRKAFGRKPAEARNRDV